MAESDQEKAPWWEKWGWLYWSVSLVGLGVAIGGNFWAMSLPVQLASASAAAVVGVTLGIVVLPAMLVYAGLTWLSRRISENRSKLKSVINAGRLASLLVPILCVALALSLPVTWPVFLAAAALPVAAMLMAGAYHGLRYLAEKRTPSGASVKNNSEDAHTSAYGDDGNQVIVVTEDGSKDDSILLKQAIDARNVDQVRAILARFVDKQAPMIEGGLAPAYATRTYAGKRSPEQNDILDMLTKHHQSAMMTPRDRLYNALMAGKLSKANDLILSGESLRELTQDQKNEAMFHLIKTYKSSIVPNEEYLEVGNTKHSILVVLLIANGANPNAQDVEMNAALHLAISNGHDDLAEKIIRISGKQLRINLKNTKGETPLSLVVSRAPELLGLLLKGRGDAVTQLQRGTSETDRIEALNQLMSGDKRNFMVSDSIKLLEDARPVSQGQDKPPSKNLDLRRIPFGLARRGESGRNRTPGDTHGG